MDGSVADKALPRRDPPSVGMVTPQGRAPVTNKGTEAQKGPSELEHAPPPPPARTRTDARMSEPTGRKPGRSRPRAEAGGGSLPLLPRPPGEGPREPRLRSGPARGGGRTPGGCLSLGVCVRVCWGSGEGGAAGRGGAGGQRCLCSRRAWVVLNAAFRMPPVNDD